MPNVGRADALTETPFQTARREAWEEIGLPLQDAKLPSPFRVEHLCQMPANLARTELAVRPCVAFLAADRTSSTSPSSSSSSSEPIATTQTAEDLLIPRLSPHEVAAVFTAPFRNFLMAEAEESASAGEAEAGVEAAGFPAKWYQGAWTDWHESRWRMHNFYVPVGDGKAVVRAKGKGNEKGDEREGDQGTAEERPRKRTGRSTTTGSGGGESKVEKDALSDSPKDALRAAGADERFRVFGMTARILVDAARVAYDEEPRFEHNSHFGDEDMISRLLRMGRLSPERKKGDVLTREVLREAAKL